MLELSVVLVIVALVLAMSFAGTMGILDSARRAATENKLDQIERALLAFRLTHNRLPCPGDLTLDRANDEFGKFGKEAQGSLQLSTVGTAATNCVAGSPSANFFWNSTSASGAEIVEGAVPVRSLGLPDEFINDGWGRRFVYAVDGFASSMESFPKVFPSDSCSLQVKGAAGATRAAGAAYVLLSYGPNGHGGFFGKTTRLSASSLDADELANCHCGSDGATTGGSVSGSAYRLNDAPYYVQKEAGDEAGTFDDLVRFKMRWQLLDADDRDRAAGQWPTIALAYDNGIQLMSYRCGVLTQADALPDTGAFVGFFPDNSYLFSYAGGACTLYENTGLRYFNTGNGTVESCPADGGLFAMSRRGDVVMATGSAPYVRLWRISGSRLVSATGTTPVYPSLTGRPASLSMTDDGYMLALLNGSGQPVVYMRSEGEGFIELGSGRFGHLSQPTGIISNPSAIAWSPDGKYFAADGGEVAGVRQINLWRFGATSTFSAVSSLSMAGSDAPNILSFSPDARNLVISGSGSGSPYLEIYAIDAGDRFTKVFSDTTGVGAEVSAAAFSRDSRYLVVATSDGQPVIEVLHRFATDQWGEFTGVQPTVAHFSSNMPTAIALNH
ncbi:MAG: WD40 repeat domain-containing protein [Pirellulales bacterium]|nr:WD40 repeat domain-containing protein [Pirellulales bacterium]